jgi:nucleoside-diphosphate-sugar epimerase
MPTALVTGSRGQVGRRLVGALKQSDWDARGFDLLSGDDVRNERSVLAAAENCDLIMHAGAMAHDSAGTPADILATNVLGTWHVLLAAEHWHASKVVYFSSAQVFGFAEGEGTPDYRPVDDNHPLRAARPYGMSKRLAEEMCAAWTSRTGIPSVVLRPVMILDDEGLQVITEWDAELGAFVHVDDVVDAAIRAANWTSTGHHRMTLCGPGEFDTSLARRLLGWSPSRTWPRRS